MKTGIEIAVIGISCRFPGAENLEEFWENLKQGKETVSFFANNELRENGVSEEELNNPNYVKAGGVLEGIEYFDAAFFGYTPKEAEIMDPQIRVFHECVWNALEDAGYDPGDYDGLIGLYAGAALNLQWLARALLTGKDNDIGSFAAQPLIHKDFLTLRISYKLDLKGPSFELSTACSTSLVAVHVASQALLSGECDMAMAGGIRISNLEKKGYLYREGMILSPDGHCKAFAAGAKGTIGADGAGVVVLKGLEDAVLDRDHIYAIIKGTAINNDGIRKAGFSASSVAGQAEVIGTALQVAGVEPESIGYIETHGTGTELGDPVEIEALKSAFKTTKKSFCALGSVKSNLGHTDAAAGVAGFIKTVMALKYRLIPPTLHFEVPNPYIDFIDTPFYIDTKLSPWEKGEYPRRAGVSSFGIGGTNAHVIVEEWPEDRKQIAGTGENRLILLSACTGPALDRMKKNLAGCLQRRPDLDLGDLAYTLQVGRRAFNHRWMTVCSGSAEAVAALTTPGAGETHECGIEAEKSEPIDIEPGTGKEWLWQAGRWWLQGQKINWRTLYPVENYPAEKPYRLSLPHYSFEKQRYWLDFENPVFTASMMKATEPVPGMPGQLTGSHPRPNLSSPYTAPRNPVETTLAGIWQNLLGFDKVGISDDFLELRGDSLRAITAISRIHRESGVNIPVTEFFARPTIEGIAEYIRDNKNNTIYTALAPVEKKEYYALSSAQQRMYFLHRMDPGSKGYNISFVFVLHGNVNASRLEHSFKKLIQRHESLRTAFIMLPQGPAQVIHDDAGFAVEYFTGGENEVTGIYGNFLRPFDLENSPLLRIGLIKIHRLKYILMLDTFHIITDGLSFETLIEDFITLYQGNELPGVKLQYKDYVERQNRQKSKGTLNKQEAYWKKQFADEIPALDLPADKPRPPVQSFAGDSLAFALEEGEATALKALALQEGTTLYVVLLVSYYIFLAKLSNQEDIVVGTPAAGRRHADLEKIIGMFVNTLAIRNYPAAGKRVADFLAEVKENTFNAFENQDYPYEELVEQAAVNRDLSRNPLFDTMFTLQKIDVKEIVIPGLNMAPYYLENKTAKFDLSLTAMESNDKLEFIIEFCTGLFEKRTIERFSGYFKKIAAAVPGNKNKKITIHEIEIISVEEKNKILYEFNDTLMEFPGDKTIPRLFEEQVEKTPDHIAAAGTSSPFLQLSYRELNEKSDRLAYCLQEKGVEPDIIVGIKIQRSIEMITGIFGILKSGGAYLPIDPSYPRERIDYMLKDSSVQLLVTAGNWAKEGEKNPGIVFLNSLSLPAHPNSGLPNFPTSQLPNFRLSLATGHRSPAATLAYVIYTSGSTGKPKGVGIENLSVINRLNWMQRMYPLGYRDIILHKTPFTFDVSVWELFWWSFYGARLCLLGPGEEKDPAAIITAVEKYGVSVLHFVPSMLTVFLEHLEGTADLKRLAGLKHVFASGEALGLHQVETFNRLLNRCSGTTLINLYGPTEATVDVSYFNCTPPIGRHTIPIGKSIDNICLLIFDRYLKLQPGGITGELCIAGVGLARGYINRPGLTAEKFIFYRSYRSNRSYIPGRIYKTGDMARWLPDGNIEFLGRIDFQVKIRGLRIELGEIENRLLKCNHIKQALALVKTGEKTDYSIYAYLISGRQLDVTELRQQLSGALPEYMIPSYFIQVEKIPLTPGGKVDRKALDLCGKQLHTGTVCEASQNETQEKIIGIWKQVLKQDKIGIHDNYFDLGGTSLDILRINKHLKETFQIEIPIPVMFRYTTVYRLENFLNNKLGEAGNRDEKIKKGKPGKLQPLQKGKTTAIIGMAGRFPGAVDLAEFWENLKQGKETISFFSAAELRENGITDELLQEPNYVKARGILEGIQYFDASFFGYTPKEAEIMDPQIRVFHECVWSALEDAGYNPVEYEGLIGLYAGSAPNTSWQARVYLNGRHREIGDFYAQQLINKGYLTLRISYKLDLKGPSLELNTACSTALVAIHIACRAIGHGECDMAVAGGISISSLDKSGYVYREGMILSPDGHCRAFDAAAKGTIGSDGAGVVVLKGYEEAIRDRDHIYALIKGTAINNDGIRKAGFSASSVEGQVEVIRRALHAAGVEPESIGYIETHGTGTELGDPVEIEALKLAFNTGKKSFCAIGSIKANIGHTDAAAGAAGFIKAVLALNHQIIPPSLHFDIPNPYIDFINTSFYVNTSLSRWEKEEYPRRAGVSSFGIGGTNAHVILEEWAPARERTAGDRDCRLILLSAGTKAALDKMKKNLAGYLKRCPGINPGDLSYTLQVGRKTLNHRWMTVCAGTGEAVDALNSPGAGASHVCRREEEKPGALKIEPGVGKNRLIEIGNLWLHGQKIDWRSFYPGEKPFRISLPAYPFEKQKYWLDPESLNPRTQLKKLAGPVPEMADWFYFPTWKCSLPGSYDKKEFSLQRRCLVFMTDLSLGNLLVDRLKKTYRDVVMVERGSSFNQVNDHLYTLDPREYRHYEKLMDTLRIAGGLPGKIIHLWGITADNEDMEGYGAGITAFEKHQETGFFSLLYLSGALGKQSFNHEIHIHVLTNHAQEVTGNERLNPGKSTVLGLLKVIPQEYAGIGCSAVDIQLPPPESWEEDNLVHLLWEEFSTGTAGMEAEIAYRNNRRWEQVFVPLHLEAPPPAQLKFRVRQKGVFLITGGLGKIGLMFAELFVKRAGARLILTGRSPLPSGEASSKIKKLAELGEMGGEIIYRQADSGDLEEMRTVIREAEKRYGAVNGIIHSAGLTEGQSIKIIRDLKPGDCRAQFQAKVRGVMVLDELFKNKSLDFCWLLSSISCVLGGLGFGAYAAANRFMDLWVKKHNRSNSRYSRWFSLDWDGMDAARSIDIFERMFTLEKADLLVVSREGNLPERIHRWIKLRTLKEKNGTGTGVETITPSHPRPNLSGDYTASRNPVEEILAAIWQNLLGFDKIGVRDDFLELGGDSLLAITVISRIHRELGINIPVTEFFAHPTIEGISANILANKNKTIYTAIGPEEKKEYYPLSSAQLRIYILHRMNRESKGYNIPFVFVLNGNVDSTRMEYFFKKLIQRHESLRTAFIMSPSGPAQVIHDDVGFAVEYFEGDENDIPGIYGNFSRAFDLENPPLLRIGLIKIRQRKYILMLEIFHIIIDGISFDILIKDFTGLYAGKELPGIRLQYHDYVEWQNRRKGKGRLNKEEAYWQEQFAGEIPVLDIHTDYPRPVVQSFAGDRITFTLAEGEVKALKALALQEGTTLYVVLLVSYYIFLAKWSNLEDIVVGTPTAGRRHADLEKIIGMFVNILALRNYPSAGKGVFEFMGEVKKNTLNAFENQDYQYEELVEQVAVNRDLSRNPLFDTMFTLQNIDIKEIQIPGLKLAPYHFENKTSKFDLSLTGMETEDKLFFIFEYGTRLFKKETIDRLAGYFKKIVEEVLRNKSKEITIGAIEIIPPGEKRKILYEFNEPSKELPGNKTLRILFAEQVEKTPDQIAVAGPSLSAAAKPLKTLTITTSSSSPLLQLTYRELHEKSNRAAYRLQEKRVEPETIVGLMMERSVEMMIGILGILNAGGAYLPMDPSYPPDRIDYMLKDSGAQLLVTTGNWVKEGEKVRKWEGEIHYIEELLYTSYPLAFLPPYLQSPSHLAYVIYTSGSTGRPKGVMIRHKAVHNFIEGIAAGIAFTPGKTILALTTISFDIFGLETLLPFCRGLNVVIADENHQRDIRLLENIIIKNCIDMLQATPTRMQMFTLEKAEKSCLVNLKEIMVGGEKFPTGLLQDLKQATPAKIYNMYGPTETTIWSTVMDLTETEEITIGRPILNTCVYIFDRYNNVQPVGVAGGLYIGGDGLARGYLNRPGLTAENFIMPSAAKNPFEKRYPHFPKLLFKHRSPIANHHPLITKQDLPKGHLHLTLNTRRLPLYRTGDLARWQSNGNIEFLGRSDHQVKIRGFRIELGEIENRLLKLHDIKEAAVIERKDDKNDPYITAYLVPNKPIDTTALRNLLSGSLPEYMIPSFFVPMEKLPLTLNGKIDRKALPAIRLEQQIMFTAPENEIEEKLVRIWSQVLGVEADKISTNVNFFEMGGHSLKATFMMTEIEKEFDIKVPLGEIFNVPSIKKIATLIKVVAWAGDNDEKSTVKSQKHKEIIL